MLHVLDLLGAAVFAVSGALMAGRKRMDLFGVVVLAVVTAVGGGTTRDLLLGIRPIFWIADPTYVLVAVAAAFGTMLGERLLRQARPALLVADAVGLALATVLGTERALASGVHGMIAVIMGMLSGIAGGLVRDVLCGETPLILRREIYATAALASAAVLVGLSALGIASRGSVIAAILVGLGLRLAAIRWQLSLPVFVAADGRAGPDL